MPSNTTHINLPNFLYDFRKILDTLSNREHFEFPWRAFRREPFTYNCQIRLVKDTFDCHAKTTCSDQKTSGQVISSEKCFNFYLFFIWESNRLYILCLKGLPIFFRIMAFIFFIKHRCIGIFIFNAITV